MLVGVDDVLVNLSGDFYGHVRSMFGEDPAEAFLLLWGQQTAAGGQEAPAPVEHVTFASAPAVNVLLDALPTHGELVSS